jgi:folate-binding protein YgfZ
MSDLPGQRSAEWTAARNSAALFDISDRAAVELSGPDAVPFLHNLCTNDIKSLRPGRGCEFFLTTNKARIVGHGFAHRLMPADPVKLHLDLDPGSGAKVAAHCNHFIVSEQVEVVDLTGKTVQFHLCGPAAAAILAIAVPTVPALEPLQHAELNGLRIVRHDRLGLPGFDLVCSQADAELVRPRLIGAGAVQGSSVAFNILRIEAGVPLDGIDIDADRFVVEVNRIKQAISYAKGCYLGQEPIVMARDRGHANRALLGLKVDGAEPLPTGTKVLSNGEEVGHTASSVWSPLLQSVIALAYLKRGSQDAGTVVDAAGNQAVVTTLPFVAH